MADCVVVVFHSPDCPTCEAYLPAFSKIARRYPEVPAYILDVERYPAYADHYRVTNLPTTFVMRRPHGQVKAEGELNVAQIERLFQIAKRCGSY